MSAPVTRVPVPAGTLAEGPFWDAGAGGLYWVDIPAGLVHFLADDAVHDGDGQPSDGHRTWDVGQPVGAAVPRAGGGLALAVRDGFAGLDLRTGQATALAGVEAGRPGNRMNDGGCDRAGRFFAGTMANDEEQGAGALYRLDPDGRVTQMIDAVTISNGIGWSPDERLMYYVNTPTGRIDVLDYDPASGTMAGRRPFATLPGSAGAPDGLTVDAEGCVWVALWGGSAVHRYGTDGRLDRVVAVPAVNVTCCAFGGAGLDTLYITTAAGPGADEGALFRCQAGVTGQPVNPYRG